MASASSEPRRSDAAASLVPVSERRHTAVILWDLDETLIALRSQLRHAGAVETVAMMEKLLGDYLDDVFFFNVFEQFDPENVCDYFEPDRVVDGAPHHDEFREQAAEGLAKDAVKYLEYAVAAYMTDSVAKPVPSLVWWQEWQQHLRNLDAFCNQWTAQAQKILAHLRDKGCLHMAVTNTSLVAALAKLKLWGLSSFFEPRWIYSSSQRGKHAVFERALQRAVRVGVAADLVIAVGDGPEEEAAARAYQLPFVKIARSDDLDKVVQLVDANAGVNGASSGESSDCQEDIEKVAKEIDKAVAQTRHQEKHDGAEAASSSSSQQIEPLERAEPGEEAEDAQAVRSSKRSRKGSF